MIQRCCTQQRRALKQVAGTGICDFLSDIFKFSTVKFVLKSIRDFYIEYENITYLCRKIIWNLLIQYICRQREIAPYKIHSDGSTRWARFSEFEGWKFPTCICFFYENFPKRRRFSNRLNWGGQFPPVSLLRCDCLSSVLASASRVLFIEHLCNCIQFFWPPPLTETDNNYV